MGAPGTSDVDNEIRLAGPLDVAAVRACVHAAYGHYVQGIGREPAPMPADYGKLTRLRVVYVLQPLNGEGIRGVLVLRADAQVLWIENVAVSPQYQRVGYGRRLMQFAEMQARVAGLKELRLYTNELMVENISRYLRLGYVEFDRRLDDGFRRVFMRKSLEPL